MFLAVESVQTAKFVTKRLLDEMQEVDRSLLHILQMDLASFESVRNACDAFNALDVPLDWLILMGNGELVEQPEQSTVDGFSRTLQENFLSAFLACNLLEKSLFASQFSRVIIATSTAHELARFSLDDVDGKRFAVEPLIGEWRAFGAVNFAQLLFGGCLDWRYKQLQSSTSCFLLNVLPHNMSKMSQLLVGQETRPVFTTLMLMFCNVPSGRFFSNGSLHEPMAGATDPEQGRALWNWAVGAVKLSKQTTTAPVRSPLRTKKHKNSITDESKNINNDNNDDDNNDNDNNNNKNSNSDDDDDNENPIRNNVDNINKNEI